VTNGSAVKSRGRVMAALCQLALFSTNNNNKTTILSHPRPRSTSDTLTANFVACYDINRLLSSRQKEQCWNWPKSTEWM